MPVAASYSASPSMWQFSQSQKKPHPKSLAMPVISSFSDSPTMWWFSESQKKPRPKSLAISTPTRLLSLEEARERAFIGSLAHSQRFIDVGGGPSSLPSTYHTVIDLPGYR